MSRSPTNSVIQRIFVSADKSWRGNDFTLITVKPYAAAAIKALNCMIPECTFRYGKEAAQKWFSNADLLAYQNVNYWDPTTQATTSHQDHATRALVDVKTFFNSAPPGKVSPPIMQPQAAQPQNQSTYQPYSVENLLVARQSVTDVHHSDRFMVNNTTATQ
jgi:hypothetical protein